MCKGVTTRAQLSDEATLVSGHGASGGTNAFDVKCAERTLPGKQRSKSMSRAKEEQQARLTAVRQAAAEAQMLGDFIRLADYMTVVQ